MNPDFSSFLPRPQGVKEEKSNRIYAVFIKKNQARGKVKEPLARVF
jgi:hypothetical protein